MIPETSSVAEYFQITPIAKFFLAKVYLYIGLSKIAGAVYYFTNLIVYCKLDLCQE